MTYNVDNSVPYAQQNGVLPTENPGKTLGIGGSSWASLASSSRSVRPLPAS